MKSSPSETARLGRAVAALAATMVELIDARCQKFGAALEQRATLPVAEPILDRKQVAEYFQVTLRTVENWSREGILPYYKIRSVTRYRLSDILALWEERFAVRRSGALRRPPPIWDYERKRRA